MGDYNKFGNIMFDIETLDNKYSACILSIGAVEFNKETGETGEELYIDVDLQSCLDEGLTIGASTFKWWMQQSEEARSRIYNATGVTLEEALEQVFAFVKKCGDEVNVWGNGSTFDITILSHALYKFFIETPWKYYNVKDVRTIVDINPSIKKNCPFQGVKHDALADCHHQIKYLTETLKSIKTTK